MEMDKAVVELMNDSLQEMIEKRHSMMIDENAVKDEAYWSEFAYLSDAINRAGDTIPKMYKVENDRELDDKFKEKELNIKEEQLKKELELKNDQHRHEMELKEKELSQKEKQLEQEIEIRKAELEMKQKQFEEELKKKDEQHENELKQKEKSEKWKTIGAFAGVTLTVIGTVAVGVITKKIEIEAVSARLEEWIPQLMEFEKNDSFSYPAAKAMEKLALRM